MVNDPVNVTSPEVEANIGGGDEPHIEERQAKQNSGFSDRLKQVYEKGRLAGHQEYEQRMAAQQIPQSAPMQQHSQMDESRIRQAAAEEAKKQYHDMVAMHVANTFLSKIAPSEGDPSDYNQVMGLLHQNYSNPYFGHAIKLAAESDNTKDVMYELLKNDGAKIHQINNMMMVDPSGTRARQAVAELAASAKTNKIATSQKVASDPINQITPTNFGADSGNMSISERRRNPKFRG